MKVAYVEKMDGKQLRFAIHLIRLGTLPKYDFLPLHIYKYPFSE